MKKTRITLNSRDDRLGSNFIHNLSQILLAKINNSEIYRIHNLKYRNELIYKPILKISKLRILPFPKDNLDSFTGIRGRIATVVIQSETDFITLFKRILKDEFFNVISKTNSKFFSSKNRYICIHIRNEDSSKIEDYDGNPTYDYIKNLLENKNFELYDRKKMLSLGEDRQAPIGTKKLDNLIIDLCNKYQIGSKIKIISSGILSKELIEIINKHDIELITSGEVLQDLRFMINSEVLVLSKSFFSLIAGLLHQGKVVHYPKWGSFAALGLGSKYDKSNWVPYN